jgi:hypothetical protein
MYTMILIIPFLVLLVCVLWLNHKIEKEKKRNRTVQAFLAGIIRVISDYKSKTDETSDEGDLPARTTSLPIPYDTVLENIDWEFGKDFLLQHYEEWLKHDRDIFFEEPRYGGDGFNFMYLDFFDRRLRAWSSGELMSQKNREYLRDDVEITKDNVGELEGEIGMVKDLMKGKLDHTSFTPENIDAKMQIMFNHINAEKLEEAKKAILERISP